MHGDLAPQALIGTKAIVVKKKLHPLWQVPKITLDHESIYIHTSQTDDVSNDDLRVDAKLDTGVCGPQQITIT
eukprot:scaffold7279_cov175-Amphora_coffeaeformis.AAC.3